MSFLSDLKDRFLHLFVRMVYTHGVPNFVQVAPGVYRGGEPTDEGWQYLNVLGIKTIVKLNFDVEGSDVKAKSYGMNVITCAIPPGKVSQSGVQPSGKVVAMAVNTLRDRRNSPVYVHCTHGQDRTGLIVGMFRVLDDGWTKDQAWKEMIQRGFHRELLGLDRFWHAFDPSSTWAKR